MEKKKTYKEQKDIEHYTVAEYLAKRLSELGVKHMFGVPGNHLGPFLSIMQDSSPIRWRGNTNEINGGYAADGYARVNGISAIGVTYGVGALSLINTVSGAFVEHVPMVVINAAPTFEQHLNYQAIGLLTSHMSPYKQSNLEAYRQVTISAERITNSHLAPMQIDQALTMCITEQRPVYLEIYEDVFTGKCEEPKVCKEPKEIEEECKDLEKGKKPEATKLKARPRSINHKNVEKAVDATLQMIKDHDDLPIFWGGIEIGRKNLAEDFKILIEKTGIPYCTSIMGKSILSEKHERFHGIYNGNASEKRTYRIFNCAAKCRIGLGAWTTSKNLGGMKAMGEDWATADHEGVRVGSKYFPNVDLGAYIRRLTYKIVNDKKYGEGYFKDIDYYQIFIENAIKKIKEKALLSFRSTNPEDTYKELKFFFPDLPMNKDEFFDMLKNLDIDLDAQLTYDSFFARINQLISNTEEDKYAIVADAGFSLLGSQNIHMPYPNTFFSQTSWLSIGYSVGAATGLKTAFSEEDNTDRRVFVFVGDGSFQETCQAMSSHTRHHQNNVVFIMNNEDFYGIEQMLVDAKFYNDKCKIEGDFYNELQPWNYTKLASVFGNSRTPMHGHDIQNHRDLEVLLARLSNPEDEINNGPNIVQLRLSKTDYPSSINYKVESACNGIVPNPCTILEDELKEIMENA